MPSTHSATTLIDLIDRQQSNPAAIQPLLKACDSTNIAVLEKIDKTCTFHSADIQIAVSYCCKNGLVEPLAFLIERATNKYIFNEFHLSQNLFFVSSEGNIDTLRYLLEDCKDTYTLSFLQSKAYIAFTYAGIVQNIEHMQYISSLDCWRACGDKHIGALFKHACENNWLDSVDWYMQQEQFKEDIGDVLLQSFDIACQYENVEIIDVFLTRYLIDRRCTDVAEFIEHCDKNCHLLIEPILKQRQIKEEQLKLMENTPSSSISTSAFKI